MARVTNLELTQLLAAANIRIVELTEQLSIMTAERDMFARKLIDTDPGEDLSKEFPRGEFPHDPKPAPKPTYTPIRRRPVYEFNPNLAGDFQRAQKLARKNNGIVVRALA